MKKFIPKAPKGSNSSLLKKLLIAEAITAAAAAAFTAVKVIKTNKQLLPGKPSKRLNRAKNIYISGGSLASLAAAAYLIKDGEYDGRSVHIFGAPAQSLLSEEYGSIGPEFRALMADIDAHSDDDFSIDTMLDNIEFAAAPDVKIIDVEGKASTLNMRPSRSLMRALSKALKKAASSSADELDGVSITEYFSDYPELLESDLFTFIEITFGIRPECRVGEFLARLEQLVTYAPKAGLYDTLYYDFSSAEILEDYLEENGVEILRAAQITGIDASENKISALHIINDGTRMTIYLNKEDIVILEAGNISDNASEGSFSEIAPTVREISPSAALWANAASNDDSFGLPDIIMENAQDYIEFSIIDECGYLLSKICAKAQCDSDNGLSVLLPGSNWRMKITSEPYSLNAPYNEDEVDSAVSNAVDTTADTDCADVTPEDINAAKTIAANIAVNDEPQPVITVKGVYTGSEGNYVDKTMRECTGVELLYELCCHLGMIEDWDEVLEKIRIVMVNCYPYKTAPLFITPAHALPELRPCDNCAVISAFMSADAPACTLEQEIQSAKKAAYSVMNKKNKRSKSKYFDLKKL